MPCTGLWFNKPPGIRPCPLYTPPVALTDGLLCEFEGLYFYIRLAHINIRKLKRTVWSKGKRSRNKASVGEPADGSLRIFTRIISSHTQVTYAPYLPLNSSNEPYYSGSHRNIVHSVYRIVYMTYHIYLRGMPSLSIK